MPGPSYISNSYFRLRRQRMGQPLDSDERGISMLEFVMIVPFLLLCFAMVYDLGNILIDCMVFSQTAGEGVRTLSGFPSLPPGVQRKTRTAFLSEKTTRAASCSSPTPPTSSYCGYFKAQLRMHELMLIHGIEHRFEWFETEYVRTGSDTVITRIQVRFEGGLIMNGLRFTLSHRGPYLF